jgi:hypothetical protein
MKQPSFKAELKCNIFDVATPHELILSRVIFVLSRDLTPGFILFSGAS